MVTSPSKRDGYPRSYSAQRQLEQHARATREQDLERGVNLQPMCGYEYKPKGNGHPNAPQHAMCYRTAGEGTTHRGKGYCDYHEVEADKQILKQPAGVKNEIAKARTLAYKSALFFGEPVNVDPHTALLEEVHRTAGIVRWLEGKLARLNESGMPEDDVLTQYTKQHGMTPSVWMLLFQEERNRLVQVASAAIKAGVAERRVQLAEQQGRLIAEIMLAFIRDPELGLTQAQMMKAPDIIRKHLQLIPSTERHDPVPGAIEATVIN